MKKFFLLTCLTCLGYFGANISGQEASPNGFVESHEAGCGLSINRVLPSKTLFANFFSNVTQLLAPGAPVTFELQNAVNGIKIDVLRQTIQFLSTGFYSISYTASGSAVVAISQDVVFFPWDLGLFLDNSLVPGSVSAINSAVTDDGTIGTRLFGQVIIGIREGSILQLRNTSLTPVALFSNLDPTNPAPQTSVSINIIKLNK